MKRFSVLLAALLATASLEAKVTLPSIFSDNMVLQQKSNVAFWGTATGRKVTITASWGKGKTVVTPDADGKWFVRIATPEAGGPYEITLSDGDKTVLRNVLLGEVWYCSGQSNMVLPLNGFHGQPVEHAAEYILSARPSVPIRIIKVPEVASFTPVETGGFAWRENTPEAASQTSAVAYFFARKLYEALQIPVGIIVCAWSGTSIETWMPREAIDRACPGEFNYEVPEGEHPEKRPCPIFPYLLYNGMVQQLIPFTFKGMLWYQGETNRGRAEQYTRLQPAYVAMMREKFQNPDAPFYFVQIAPFGYGKKARPFIQGYFVEAQQKTLSLIPHSGMATTVDVGELESIHPARKLEVATRLAMLALTNDYGFKGIDATAPTYKSVRFEDGKAIVSFNCYEMGLNPGNIPVGGFEIAGDDRVFHPATAIAQRSEVTVTSSEVPHPIAVRYCFRNWAVGTLTNSFGVPLAPFRTDDWDIAE